MAKNRFCQLINRSQIIYETVFVSSTLFNQQTWTRLWWVTGFDNSGLNHLPNLPLHLSHHLGRLPIRPFPYRLGISCIYFHLHNIGSNQIMHSCCKVCRVYAETCQSSGAQGEETGRRLANGGARQRRRRGKCISDVHTELLDHYVMMGLRELCDYEIMMRGRLCYDRVLRTMRISVLRSERNKDWCKTCWTIL